MPPEWIVPEQIRDFKKFLYLTWKHLSLPDPTPIQYDIADYLQHGPRRKVVEAFRGVGKSWITSAYVVWRLRCDPQLNFLVVSASKNRADDFSTFTLRLINDMPILSCLIPQDGQRNSKIAFDVAPALADHAPSVKSVGIYGQLTGGRADEVVADDIEVPGNSYTQMMREKLSNAIKEFDAVLKPGGKVTYLGTPQTELSIYNLLGARGYETRIWPARFPTAEQLDGYGPRLAPAIATALERHGDMLLGKPTDKKRFTELDLMEREASYGRSGFALQFMLDTSLSDANKYPLKLKDLLIHHCPKDVAPEQVCWATSPDLVLSEHGNPGLQGDRFYRPMWVSPNMIPYTGSVMAIDPSGRGQDETTWAVVKMLNGYLWCTEVGGCLGGYEDKNLKHLADVARNHKVNAVIVESNFGDGMFTQLLTPHLSRVHPVLIEEVRNTAQKERRIIDTLEPVMNQHRLILDPTILAREEGMSYPGVSMDQIVAYKLTYQMTRITKDRGALRHDDRLDALAMAVGYWNEAMAQDADKKVAEREDALMDQELKSFFTRLKNVCVVGRPSTDSIGKNILASIRRGRR